MLGDWSLGPLSDERNYSECCMLALSPCPPPPCVWQLVCVGVCLCDVTCLVQRVGRKRHNDNKKVVSGHCHETVFP